jgi:hypothetical protein
MDPISNPIFGHDFERFVLQNPHLTIIHQTTEIKPFDINASKKSEKSKKDLKKQKDK